MGKKYIIELLDECDSEFKGIMVFGLTPRNQISTEIIPEESLTPYTEPDMEQVKRDYDAWYEKGLADAWEAARKIGSNSMCSLEGMGFDFSQCVIDDYNPSWFVVKNYSASECIEKIRQYEQEKEEQEQSVTAEEVMRQYLDTFCNGKSCTRCPLHTPDFTCGRGYHFLTNKQVSDEEVRKAYAAVLAKMKES